MHAILRDRCRLSDYQPYAMYNQNRDKLRQRPEPQSGTQQEDHLAIMTGGLLVLRAGLSSFARMCVIFGLLLFLAIFTLPEASGQSFVTGIEGFETSYDGWTADNTNIWKVGKPTAGPGKAFDGTNCAGTGLTGNAPANQSSRLVSPVFMVPAANQNPRLRWWQWFQFGSSDSGSDGGNFQISTNNGTSWQTLASVDGTSGGWSEGEVNLTVYAGQSVQIAFYFQSGNYWYDGGTGWFVDDVTLVTGPITTVTPNTPVGFENGLGDWSVNNGVWAVGEPTAGPGKAYDGTNCAGTGLTGNAPADQGSSLISPVFVVPAANQNPRLRWWQWFQFGASDNGTDVGDFLISTNQCHRVRVAIHHEPWLIGSLESHFSGPSCCERPEHGYQSHLGHSAILPVESVSS
jgi:hypothetical protein